MDVRAEVVDILAGFALFADLTTPELENLVDTFDEQMFSEGERVVRQGLSSASFYVILDGAATIRVDGKDRATLRPGDFFGEISCLLGETAGRRHRRPEAAAVPRPSGNLARAFPRRAPARTLPAAAGRGSQGAHDHAMAHLSTPAKSSIWRGPL